MAMELKFVKKPSFGGEKGVQKETENRVDSIE